MLGRDVGRGGRRGLDGDKRGWVEIVVSDLREGSILLESVKGD